jgi:hypothetical protein
MEIENTNFVPKNILLFKYITNIQKGYRVHLFEKEEDILIFFKENPDENFKDITNKYLKLKKDQKRFLFVLYFLYQKGGFYIEPLLCSYANLNKFIESGLTMLVVKSSSSSSSIYSGLMASTYKNEIIKNALIQMYSAPIVLLDNDSEYMNRIIYHLVIKEKETTKILTSIQNQTGLEIYDEKGDNPNEVLFMS